MRSTVTRAVLVLALAITALPATAGSGADFPFPGTYGADDPKWPGCADARLQREGSYVRISGKEIFVHETACAFVSWTKTGPSSFDVVQRCRTAKPFTQRLRIDAVNLTYQGRVYRRCSA